MLKKILQPLLISTIFILLSAPLAMAQDPSPFEISIDSENDIATTGQQFVYTIKVTNTSNAPVREAVVSAGVPEWAGFVHAETRSLQWYVTEPLYGESGGRTIWYHPEAMQPNEVVTFKLIVEVLNEVNIDKLTTDVFVLIGEENRYEIGSGPTLDVPVVTATPGPSLKEAGATKVAGIYATQTAVIDARAVAEANKEATRKVVEANKAATKKAAQATRKAQPTATPTATQVIEEVVEAVTEDNPVKTEAETSTEAEAQEETGGGILSYCMPGLMMLGLLGVVLVQRTKN